MMKNLFSILIAAIIFIVWLQLVGNPHVVETVIGLILAISAGVYFHFKIFPIIIIKFAGLLFEIQQVLRKFGLWK